MEYDDIYPRLKVLDLEGYSRKIIASGLMDSQMELNLFLEILEHWKYIPKDKLEELIDEYKVF